jgi:hypothetical protein
MPQKKTQPAGAAAKPVAAKTDKPVKDLVKPMTFLIGAVDHDGACPRDEDHCPISNRLMRMPGVLDASTGSKIVFFERRDAWWRGEMDSRTYAAVLGYDGDQALIPVGFPVTLLPPKKPWGSRVGQKSGTNKRSGKGRAARPRPSFRHVNVASRRKTWATV